MAKMDFWTKQCIALALALCFAGYQMSKGSGPNNMNFMGGGPTKMVMLFNDVKRLAPRHINLLQHEIIDATNQRGEEKLLFVKKGARPMIGAEIIFDKAAERRMQRPPPGGKKGKTARGRDVKGGRGGKKGRHGRDDKHGRKSKGRDKRGRGKSSADARGGPQQHVAIPLLRMIVYDEDFLQLSAALENTGLIGPPTKPLEVGAADRASLNGPDAQAEEENEETQENGELGEAGGGGDGGKEPPATEREQEQEPQGEEVQEGTIEAPPAEAKPKADDDRQPTPHNLQEIEVDASPSATG
jgi:hypothetical protein